MKALKNLFIFSLVILGIVAGAAVAGPVGGFVGGTVAYAGLQLAGVVEMPQTAFFTGVSVGNIQRRSRQENNLGGFTKFAIVLPEDISAHWPLDSQITDLEITAAPTMVSGKKFGQLIFDLDGGSMKFSRKGNINNANYNHEGTFTISGLTQEQLVELDKTRGGALIVGFDQEGKRWLAGSTRRPLKIEFDGNLGGKPDDNRQISGKFSQDGFKYPLLLLEDTVTLTLETLTGLD